MQNTSGKWEYKVPGKFFTAVKKAPEYDWSYDWVNFTASGRYIIAERSQKRKKPAVLLPRNGTASSKTEYTVKTIQEGLFEKISMNYPAGRPSYPTIYLKQMPYSRSIIADGDRLLSQTYPYINAMQKTLDNKAIEKIMDGSGQLAVDLLELNKTKTMVSNAAVALLQGWKDVRAGRPLSQLVKALKKEGWNGLAGRKFLEFIYGWSPTVEGAFEVAETLSQNWFKGKYYIDTVSSTMTGELHVLSGDNYWDLDGGFTVRGKARYQYRIQNPKLALMKQLGLTNPASIVWEKTPWSFVFDWAFRFGSYLDSLDWDLGKTDIWIQHSITRDHQVICKLRPGMAGPFYVQKEVPLSSLSVKDHFRKPPVDKITPSWKGVRNPYSSQNAGTRLAVSLALLDQLRTRVRR